MEEQERKERKNRVFLLRWLAAAGVPIESSSLKSQPVHTHTHTQARPAAAAGVEEGAEKGSWGSSRKKIEEKNATTAISVFAKKLRK